MSSPLPGVDGRAAPSRSRRVSDTNNPSGQSTLVSIAFGRQNSSMHFAGAVIYTLRNLPLKAKRNAEFWSMCAPEVVGEINGC